jgi:hypothetical protein
VVVVVIIGICGRVVNLFVNSYFCVAKYVLFFTFCGRIKRNALLLFCLCPLPELCAICAFRELSQLDKINFKLGLLTAKLTVAAVEGKLGGGN